MRTRPLAVLIWLVVSGCVVAEPSGEEGVAGALDQEQGDGPWGRWTLGDPSRGGAGGVPFSELTLRRDSTYVRVEGGRSSEGRFALVEGEGTLRLPGGQHPRRSITF